MAKKKATARKNRGTPSRRGANPNRKRTTQVHGDDPVHVSPDQEAQSAHEIDREDEVAVWQRPSALDAPPARRGYVQRWVRVLDRNGQPDITNIQKKHKEGWRPRKVDTIEEGFAPPTIQDGQWAGCIGVRSVVLMEMPIKVAKQRDAYYRKKREQQTEAVNTDIERTRGGHGFGNIRHKNRSEVEVPTRRPAVAGDDDDLDIEDDD